MSRLAALLYLATVALIGALLAALWLAPGPLTAWRQWQAPPAQAPNLDDVQAALLRANPAAIADYPVVLARPLFDPARRPRAAAGAEAAVPAAALDLIDQLRLQGIVAGSALTGVMLEEQGKSRFVRVGERVGHWTLTRIEGRDAVFQRHGEERRLPLPVAHADAESVASSAPAVPNLSRRPAVAVPGAARPVASAAAAVLAPAPLLAPVPTKPRADGAASQASSASATRRGTFGGSRPSTAPPGQNAGR